MEVLKVQKGQIIAKKNDKVKEWYFIQEGSVIQKYAFVELELKQNGIVGILENDRFLCDYIAADAPGIRWSGSEMQTVSYVYRDVL